MRLVAWSDRYPPNWCAGSELMLHEILRLLQDRGHDVEVLCPRATVDSFDGIALRNVQARNVPDEADNADVFITHLESVRDVINLARGRAPLAYICHFPNNTARIGLTPRQDVLVVFNALATKQATRWPGRSVVVPPPVNAERYATTPGECNTLININTSKGGPVFWELARELRGQQFLAVKGAYGQQTVPRQLPANVTVMDHTADIVSAYQRTRVLLMPSAMETYGRTAIEAAASGIPTVAAPTPGLKEALGDAGIFVPRSNLRGWIDALVALQDPDTYATASMRALERSAHLNPRHSIDHLEQALTDLSNNFRRTRAKSTPS